MFKAVALLTIVGVASAGHLGLGYGGVAVSGHGADIAALNRNANLQAAGAYAGAVRDAAAINGAIATSAAGAAQAAAVDRANQQAASNTLALINADSANRNAINAATLNNYGNSRNAAIQSQQLALARSSIAYGGINGLGLGGINSIAYGGLGGLGLGLGGRGLAYNALGQKVVV